MSKPIQQRQLAVSRRIILVHTIGIVLLLLSGMGTLFIATYRFNLLQREGSQVMVETQVLALLHKAEVVVRDYSVWDEAFTAFRNGDVDWLYRNIGTGAAEIGALDLIVLLDQETGDVLRWVYDSEPDGTAPPMAEDVLAEILASRPEDPDAIDWVITTVRLVDGVPWLFAATAIRPIDLESGEIAFRDLPLQIQGVRIGPQLLDDLAAPILVEDLQVVQGAQDGKAFAPFEQPEGTETLGLAWVPPATGARLVATIFWPLSVAMILMTMIAGVASRHTVRSARALETALVEARAADRAKTEFLSNVSHELKTPMNGILGSIQLLRLTELDNEQSELVELLEVSAEHQNALVSDLLDVALMDGGRRKLKHELFVPADVVREAGSIFNKIAQDKELAFRCDLSGATETMVYGDARSLRQIISNLVGNAVKFTDDGSVSVVATALPEADWITWEVTVADTGPGIPERETERIFDRFYQIDGSLSRKKDGTGLGLAISRDLAVQMGGNIVVAPNTGGRGAAFTLTIRLDRVDASGKDLAA